MVDLHAVAPALLGHIASRVGRAERFGDAAGLGIQRQQADAHAQREGALPVREAEARNGVPQRLGHALAVAGGAMLEQHAELVAAKARQRIAAAQLAAHDLGHLPDQLVAGGMAAGVVDHLELVEVQVHQRMGDALRMRPRDRGTDTALELGAVDQAGQSVVAGLVRQPRGMRALLADIVQHHHDADRLRGAVADQRHRRLDRQRLSGMLRCGALHQLRRLAAPALPERERDQIGQRRQAVLVAQHAHLAQRLP
ncbi:hypothetical protein D3C81_1244070 [compost metagenome]